MKPCSHPEEINVELWEFPGRALRLYERQIRLFLSFHFTY